MTEGVVAGPGLVGAVPAMGQTVVVGGGIACPSFSLTRDEVPRLLGQGRLQGRAHFMLSSALPTPLPLPPLSAPSALASVFCTSLRVSKP